ncbi:hypothetical protein FAES_0374 [Fibrella aestuarina BUZ 2]|uniref:Uncharacterized protein n=1 Tax=Fibrella aestuarina BUZ 2 TaxID=1166018 RepID=I0K2N3_9BACT|nr:hypothetical protein FAES_0374 [Fibrella aestuarina BUZ 2]
MFVDSYTDHIHPDWQRTQPYLKRTKKARPCRPGGELYGT